MRRTQRNRMHDASPSGLVLPDDWPGENLRGTQSRLIRDGNEELLVPDWIRSDWVSWKRVTVIGRDVWAVAGLKQMLARCGAVRLRLLTDVPETCDPALAKADLVVWLRMHHDGLPDLPGYVATLRRRHPLVRQLVISDALPQAMPSGTCALSGVLAVRGTASMEVIYDLLTRALTAPPATGPLLLKMLNRSQWRVLLFRAAGKSTAEIATGCNIGYKTVSVHESAIRDRMHITNRAEYAWLLRCVQQIRQVVPGLTRSRPTR